ncbi:MAG: cytochrome c biogenesis protein ResB, partial [Calditrichaeota bacterium]|nr:cytochrome c biogenesis protein ResB [Calditrichota bacterium]
MKFAVWLLVVTAILALFALIAAEFLPAGISRSGIIALLQLDDPFRSLWFRILLGLLTMSLSVCILERGLKLIRQAFSISLIREPETLQSLKSYIQLEMPDG